MKTAHIGYSKWAYCLCNLMIDTVPLKVIVLIVNLEPKWKEVSTTLIYAFEADFILCMAQ